MELVRTAPPSQTKLGRTMRKSAAVVVSTLAVFLTACGQGPQGPKGEQGPPSSQGAKGEQGPPGPGLSVMRQDAKRSRRSHAHKEKFQSPKLVVRKRRHAQTVLGLPWLFVCANNGDTVRGACAPIADQHRRRNARGASAASTWRVTRGLALLVAR